jgi:hypothetical protein
MSWNDIVDLLVGIRLRSSLGIAPTLKQVLSHIPEKKEDLVH